ncbi:proprotein convertase subtilisin/kexin type 9-like [Ptychodera flava]|uniref:proprotein convertase subtilisin/kexin type 9-like n=1 Tax=Ptychodera flava TaxID=63121 RepID=UPI00396A17FC
MARLTLLTVVLMLGTLIVNTYGDLTCVTRKSELSGTSDDDQARVTCEEGEQMTGCSSYLPGPGGHGTRDGDFFEVAATGEVTCVARNGYTGTGVYAIARCCKKDNLQCGYVQSPQSGSDDDALTYVQTQLTGCSAHTYWKNIDGPYPDVEENRCTAKNGADGQGLWASAAYCSAVSLQCVDKRSEKSGGQQGDTATVSCDDGWVLTGCNSYTAYKVNDGAYVTDADECVAVNGGNNNWVEAIAICCQ